MDNKQNNENSGGLYRGLRMSKKSADIIVCALAIALTVFIGIALFLSV